MVQKSFIYRGLGLELSGRSLTSVLTSRRLCRFEVSKRFLDRIDVSKFQSSTKIEATALRAN